MADYEFWNGRQDGPRFTRGPGNRFSLCEKISLYYSEAENQGNLGSCVINLTPHPVLVHYTHKGKADICPIAPEGWVARLAESDQPSEMELPAPCFGNLVDRTLGGVVVTSPWFPDEELPPELPDGMFLVVSLPVAMALPYRRDLVSPDTGKGAVRDPQGRIIGTTGFVRYVPA